MKRISDALKEVLAEIDPKTQLSNAEQIARLIVRRAKQGSIKHTALPKALEKLFSTALDWLRYDNHCWILRTNTDLDVWRDRIRALPQIKEEDSFLLLEVNPKVRSGYASEVIWKWLQEHTNK